ncbi:neuronal acetylcholine receptor subunit alpha-6-like [Crassostrea angulata]|uniref:neuronal acetylcholine receptor subunit alpha-6-like n=1 Tax=Magallana angulata TaxID=2784310 RepID=UPI0022B094A2|nr:neuronal acetylcholine receptor subunit alpha-6-like [Crassostrea angulata]
MKMFLFVIVLTFSTFGTVCGVSTTEYKNLQKTLMTNYSNKVRPVQDQDDTVYVMTSFILADLNDVDAVQQRLVTTAYLRIVWIDEFLQWDKYTTGVERLYFKQKDIWIPDIVLKNGVNKFEELGGEFYYLAVSPNGEVEWLPYLVFESKCDIDITYFPFDTQVCDITFISWSFTKLEVNMTLFEDSPSVDFYDFVENSVWGIKSTGARRSQSDFADSTVTFTLHLHRKPLYYVMNLILPVVLLGVISLLVFVIPADAGEKMSFAVTVFLSFAVFLSIISMQLPVNSEKTSLLGVYLVFQMSIAVATIIVSAFQLRLHHRCEERKVGTFYRGIVRIERCLRCVKFCSDKNSKKKYDWRNDSCEPKVDYDDVGWKDVSSAIDFVCFWTMLFFGIIVTTVLVVYMNNGIS